MQRESPPPLADGAPPDAELREAVKKLRNGRAGDGSDMWAEDIKSWLRGMEREEEAERKGKEGHEGDGDTWRLFVRLLQHVWNIGKIPRQILLSVVVLIPKGGNDYRGMGPLEVAWKVLEGVLDRRMQGILLHDALHGFRQKRGCGTGIMEAKLVQQLAFIEQSPLYGLFLDLRKAYDAMDIGRCL